MGKIHPLVIPRPNPPSKFLTAKVKGTFAICYNRKQGVLNNLDKNSHKNQKAQFLLHAHAPKKTQ